MSHRVLVTGSSGFVGRNLVTVLLEAGCTVFALDRNPVCLPEGAQAIQADLTDPESLRSVDKEWDWVIHLAGATIPALFTGPAPLRMNLDITINLLEHLQGARVLLVSSCHVYAPASMPRREDSTLSPQGFYGLSKSYMEQLAPFYRKQLDIRIARPFNHLGPGSPPSLVVPSLLRRLLTEPAGSEEPLTMQGRDSTRDFIDVKDVVEAYMAILNSDGASQGVFNVCTGTPVRISEVAAAAMDILNGRRPVIFTGDPNSRDDNDFIVGDPSHMKTTTGWQSRFQLNTSLATIINNYLLTGTL